MAMRTFYNEIKGIIYNEIKEIKEMKKIEWMKEMEIKEIKGMKEIKVSELPAHLKPLFTADDVRNSVKRVLDNYHAKYIETSSVDPIFHICFGGMIFSYLVALPEERRHLEHARNTAAIDPLTFKASTRCSHV